MTDILFSSLLYELERRLQSWLSSFLYLPGEVGVFVFEIPSFGPAVSLFVLAVPDIVVLAEFAIAPIGTGNEEPVAEKVLGFIGEEGLTEDEFPLGVLNEPEA